MENQNGASSAYAYPLLIKNILLAPVAYRADEEIVYRGSLRLTYRNNFV